MYRMGMPVFSQTDPTMGFFGKPLTPLGALHFGQEPDDYISLFSELQALDGEGGGERGWNCYSDSTGSCQARLLLVKHIW